MSEHVCLSINELHALLNRYFEAAFGHSLDFYDAARSILWLETHGASGIDLLLNAPSARRRGAPVISVKAENEFHIDALNANGVAAALAASDLARAKAVQNGYAGVHLRNHDCQRALIACVAKMSEAKVTAFALWKSSEDPRTHFVLASPENTAPAYYAGLSDRATNLEDGEGVLWCIDNPEEAEELLRKALGMPIRDCGLEKLTSANECQLNYDGAVDCGVEVSISNYKALCEFADKILVESSEASRRGAGD